MLTVTSSDIAHAVDREEIFENFKKIWGIPLSHGSKVLAVTVPRATMDGTDLELVERRNAVNEDILGYAKDGLYVSQRPLTRDHECLLTLTTGQPCVRSV